MSTCECAVFVGLTADAFGSVATTLALHCPHNYSSHICTIIMPPRSFPAVVSDSCILELFASPSMRLKAHRVLHLLGLPRSKVRNIQSALRRLARSGALVELSSPSPSQRHPLYARSPIILSHTSGSVNGAADTVGDSQTIIATEALSTSSHISGPFGRTADTVEDMHATPAVTAQSACVLTRLVTSSVCRASLEAVSIPNTQCVVLQTDDCASAEEKSRPSQPMCVVCRESWPTEVLLPCRHQACCKTCWSRCVVRERTIHNRRERLKRELGARGHVRAVFRARCPVCMAAVDEVISPYTHI